MKRVLLVTEDDLRELKSAMLDRSWLRPLVEAQVSLVRSSFSPEYTFTDAVVTQLERRIEYELDQWSSRGSVSSNRCSCGDPECGRRNDKSL